MSKRSIEQDRFQVLCRKASDAISNYFFHAHSSTVLHITHAANTLIRDLRRHYVSESLISDFELWTEMVDREAGSRLFNPEGRDENLKPLAVRKGGGRGGM